MRYLVLNIVRSSYNAYRKIIATGKYFSTGSTKISHKEKSSTNNSKFEIYPGHYSQELHFQQFSSGLMFSDVVGCSVKQRR